MQSFYCYRPKFRLARSIALPHILSQSDRNEALSPFLFDRGGKLSVPGLLRASSLLPSGEMAIDPNELRQATGDVFYEANMLQVTYIDYWKRAPSNPPIELAGLNHQLFHNCIMEATLVHVRCLLDFFEKTRKRPANVPRNKFNMPDPDDVLAEDYGFDVAPIPIRADMRRRINTSIAHLSYGRTRLNPTDKSWDFASFIPPILKRSGLFFKHLIETQAPRSNYPDDARIAALISYAASLP